MPSDRPALPRRRAQGSVLRRMVVFSTPAALLVSVVTAVVAWAVAGEGAAVSALAGGALGTGVFLAGLLAIAGVVAGPVSTSMAGAFAVLVLQLVLAGALLWVLSRTEWAQMLPLGIAFLAAGLAFQAGVVTGYAGSRRLVFGEDEPAKEVRE